MDEGQQGQKAWGAVLAVTRPDRLEVKPTIPDASDGMAGGVGISEKDNGSHLFVPTH